MLLVLAAGARLSAYIGATVGEIGFLRGIWLDGSRRLAWLEDYAAVARGIAPTRRRPRASREGIRFEHVSFAYPGTERLVLDDVDLDLPAGLGGGARRRERRRQDDAREAAVPAVRADARAASWSTASSSRACRADAWRARLAGAFQDFFRFELRARHSVGVGDVPRLDDAPAVAAAVERAGADDVVAQLAAGLDTQLGPTWPGGVEVSASASGRSSRSPAASCASEPLLLVLDEPTAALDAETEHALFERYAAAARGAAADGRITMLVSHRFSTVRMADLIVVLDGARVVEIGTHDELMAKRGQYAELYGIQAAAYR